MGQFKPPPHATGSENGIYFGVPVSVTWRSLHESRAPLKSSDVYFGLENCDWTAGHRGSSYVVIRQPTVRFDAKRTLGMAILTIAFNNCKRLFRLGVSPLTQEARYGRR